MRVPRRDVPLIATAVAYSLAHHLGSLPDGLGDAGRGTRVADWLDLLVPFVVLLPALGTLLAAGVSRATYLWFAVGSWLYATGHGIHLSANSIGNAAPGETAHLWDEQVGHWVWYAGVAVIAATLASTLVERPVPRHGAGLAAGGRGGRDVGDQRDRRRVHLGRGRARGAGGRAGGGGTAMTGVP